MSVETAVFATQSHVIDSRQLNGLAYQSPPVRSDTKGPTARSRLHGVGTGVDFGSLQVLLLYVS